MNTTTTADIAAQIDARVQRAEDLFEATKESLGYATRNDRLVPQLKERAEAVVEAEAALVTWMRLAAATSRHGELAYREIALDELTTAETDINKAEGRRKAVQAYVRLMG